ncbi:MAG: site-specific integrase [Ruthenibacterium sp.]
MQGKRGKGEGNLRRLPSGNWFGQMMDGYTDAGKRNVVSFTAPTRSEVLDKMEEYRAQKVLAPVAPQQEIQNALFSSFAEEWYAAYRTQVEESTYSNYFYTLALLKKWFREKPITELKTMEINAFMNHLEAQGYSYSQISKCRSMLIQIFDAAESDDLVQKNYARKAFHGTKRAAKEKSTHKKDAFTVDEVAILMEQLPHTLIGYSIRLMLVTGLRMQELLALTPQDIGTDGSWVNVKKAVKMVAGKPVLGVPKSSTSTRTIPIAPKYREIARWLRENGGQAFLWCAAKRDNLLVDTGTARRSYYRTLAKMPGVRRLSPHCCRHTYVTLLQRQGVPMETISKLTGHTDIQTTGVYLHIGSDTLEQAVKTLETL